MPRRASRSLGCAGDRPSAAPSAASRQPQPQTLALRSRAGWTARLRWGGGAVSAANAGIKDAPSSPRSSSEGGLASRWFNVLRDSDASRTTLSLHRGDLFSARSSLRSARHRAASPQDVPHREAPPVVASGRSSLPRRPSASHRAGVVGSPLERRCFGYALMSRRPRRLTLRAAFGSLSQTVPRPSARRKGKWRRKPRRSRHGAGGGRRAGEERGARTGGGTGSHASDPNRPRT